MAYTDSPITELLQEPQMRRLTNLAVVVLLVLSVALFYLTASGYGALKLEGVPANATVLLNNHATADRNLSLRPGSYQLIITSPTTAPFNQTVEVSLWRQTDYTPKLARRSPEAIAGSLLGAIPGTSFAPKFTTVRWFSSNTWLAGQLTPSTLAFVAHYDAAQGTWVVAFCNSPGYPNSLSLLPTDVAGYVQPLLQGGV